MAPVSLLTDRLRTSLWFVPVIMVVASALLAALLLWLDGFLGALWQGGWLSRLLGGLGSDRATGMLQAIAGSMITVVALVCTLTTAAISQASAQYTSRVLRSYLRDRITQAVLGALVGVFVYCLLVFGAISTDGEPAVLAVLGAVLLTLFAVSLLVYFVHHIARSLQASSMAEAIALETQAAVNRLYPPDGRSGPQDGPALMAPVHTVRAHYSGYVEIFDHTALCELARELKTVIHVRRAVGEFITAGDEILTLCGGDAPDETQGARLARVAVLGAEPTLEQDVGFGIRQLVDVALKALSPGVNETTTAIICIDWLGVILRELAERPFPSPRLEEDGELRAVLTKPAFGDHLAAGFNQIRQSAASNVAVMVRLLDVLGGMVDAAMQHDRQSALTAQIDALEALAERTIHWPPDREPVMARVARLRERLG